MVNTQSVRVGNSSQPLGRGQPPNSLPPQLPPPIPNTFPHRGVPPPHHTTNSIPHPLNTNITLEPYPAGFRIPQLETYDGTKDPDDHLHALYCCMQAQNASDALMCKFFPSTLRGNAQTWYYSLPPRDGESLKNYMSRFNDAVLEVSSFDQAVGIAAVISSLKHDRFRDSLIKHTATTFSEVNDRSLKFITAEEYALMQNPTPNKNQSLDWRDENPSKKRMRMAQNRGPMPTSTLRFGRPNSAPPQQSAGKPPVNWTPFNLLRSQIFMQIKNKMDLRRPDPMRTTVRAKQPRFVREQRTQPQGVCNPPNREVKHQNRAQKRKFDDNDWKNQPITFTSADFDTVVTPHNDHLATSVIINNCEVQHVLVDTESALDIMERLQVIKEEIEKLLQVGFVRKVDYCEWLANPVLVKKANGKWRMCIDYTNLNQACPKDCYPMPSIDKLVEVTLGNERLSLLDAYSGYHQVPMAPEDEEKTSFYAGDEVYCYVMMPFGLKNACATYQKMVTIVFRAQIGRNLEVYVDDIVVKSLKAEDHLADLDETFNNLRKNRMRLNPAKCIFGVESGKFLGFMVSRRGIEVNPEQIRAIAEMEPPKSVKDIQRLTRRVAALHRFISKSQRSTIRAKVLADFIVECTPGHLTPNSEPNNWTLYVDGASSSKGSGAGALLIDPEGYRSEHALKFSFNATNNMAKYEALLLGLQLALELKICAIQVYSDSQLVVNQINLICKVVDLVMVKYVALVAELKCKFQKFCLNKIPPTENEQADSLSKFASNSSLSSILVFVEVLNEPSFMKPRVMEVSTDPDTPSWTNPITSFLRDGTVPEDKQEAMKFRKKASRYTLIDEVLYKRSFSLPLLRCLSPYEAEYSLREPVEELTTLITPWPFAQWGLDLLGPFIKGVGGVTHLIVGVDYFTKWVEARPLSSLTSRKIEDFVFSSIICRYGIPNQIVADNGTQFNCSSFRDFCSSYGIKLQFTSVYHPESNGMVESVNKVILKGIKPRLELHKARWADELNNVLWAYRTTSQTATGSPISMKDEMDNCFGRTLTYLMKPEKKHDFEL
ncbi:hypothetical protein SLEP1_g25472 [Rubroshorea leprosula]|uniref:Uncharacterized protein n=1 Tax=Rubroshorea leprosula TaxID=152421 RepID=A0AAV5JJB0_9ROSI|nr:hypothetical protein SLEP1_g25472 [Rubroshorea leprosula]